MPRKTESQDLGGVTVTVRQMPPRAALRLGARLGRVAGPLLAQVVTVGGIRYGDGIIPWSALEDSPEAVDALLGEVSKMLASLSPDDVVSLAEESLIGCSSWQRVGDAAPIDVPQRDGAGALLDDLAGDAATLLGATLLALRVHLLPTSGTVSG
jgi:hypothetical protein